MGVTQIGGGVPAGMSSLERVQVAALASVANAVLITDAAGSIVWVNPAFTATSGYSAQEAVGDTPRLVQSGPQDERFYRELWATLRAGRTWRGEVVNRHKAGHLYTVWQTIIPILDEAGSVAHFVAVHEDVSQLRSSQGRLQALFDNALDAIVLFDDEGRVLDANPAVCALTGYDVHALAAVPMRDLVPTSHVEAFERLWAQFMAARHARGSLPIARRDGAPVEVEFQAVAGIAPGVNLLIGHDVTAQRRLEEEQRFQAQLLEAVGQAVIATDLDGVVRYWNPAAEGLYGWPEQDVLGRSITDLTVSLDSAEQRERAEAILSQVRRGETWTGESEVVRRDGGTFTALVTNGPYVDASGGLAGIIGMTTDISDLKQAHELLERRAVQQAAVAEVGAYALSIDAPRVVGHRAEQTITELLGPGIEAEIVWPGEAPAVDSDGPSDHEVRFEIGTAGLLVARQRGTAQLEPQDLEFLRSMAHLVHAASQRATANTRLAYLATHDPMTGLANRALLLDRLEQTRAAAQRSDARFAVLMLGLDGFKLVNDGFGHEIGDEVLQLVANRLQTVIHPADTLARSGGDEFAVLCPDIPDADAAVTLAERIQDALAAPFGVSQGQLTVTVSIGIALGDRDADGPTLLRDADTAMYSGKDRGRNRTEVFDSIMRDQSRHRLDVTASLRHALASGGIKVVYQPTIELATGRIIGVEALARLELESGELVPPVAFITVAEETGHIADLGRQVLQQACADASVWVATDPAFMVSVNASPQQVAHDDITETVTQILAESGVAPANLCLEITESAALSEPGVHDVMGRLRRLGVSLAIDDFGTGYSSLSHLQRMPVDMLKIDRTFIGGMATNPQDRALVAAAIELARAFALTTTAEGVETAEDLTELIALGCHLGQGYLWSPPVSADAITAMLQTPQHDDGLGV